MYLIIKIFVVHKGNIGWVETKTKMSLSHSNILMVRSLIFEIEIEKVIIFKLEEN